MEAPNGTLADNLCDQLTTDEQSPISQSKESEIFIEKIFRKRHGTTDKGKKYENMITANIILRLISSDKVNNSYVSSNHPDFGDFDDLVVETEAHERVETTAVQLKHSGRDHLKLTQLASEKGDFSLFKYFHSSQNIKKKPQQFILLTNLKFEAPNKTKFQLDKSGLFLELSEEIISEDFLKISQDTSYCYKFQILEDGNTKIKFSKLQEFKSFLEQFRLYPNQESLETLKKSTMNRFVEMFGSNEETFEKYLNIISEWDMHEGAKNKLDRNIMQRAIALCLLSPYVENFTSGAVSPKGKTLREAICLFDFTLLRNNECDAVKQLWGDVDEDIDINEVNKVRSFYRLSSNYLSRIEEADGNVLTQLLWLMDKRPLILKEQENIEKAIELCPDAKFVVLGEGKSREWMNHRSVFQNLLDLKSKHKLYKTVMETFTVSLQGKPVLTLKDASGGNEEFLKKITINDLLEMVDSPRLIDEGKVALPDPYIERYLSLNVIDIKYLEHVNCNTVVILSCADSSNAIQNLQKIRLTTINDYLNDNPEYGASNTPVFIFSKNKCSESEFERVCSNTSKSLSVHYFKFLNNVSLEWLRSRGDVGILQNYRLHNQSKSESKFWSDEFKGSINLVIGDPGMGKTELTKSFKNNCSSKYWTVMLSPQEINLFFKQSGRCQRSDYLNLFHTFILEEKYHHLKHLDKEFFKNCSEQLRVFYVWDAIDDILTKYLNAVSDLIVLLSNKGFTQWVTVRKHLKSCLEKQLNTLSLGINHFNENEQEDYIRKRLRSIISADNIESSIQKVKSSFAFIKHVDILGIPLQIFMLTEIVLQNNKKYLTLIGSSRLLTDLYHYFIQEKFNIFYQSKRSLNIRDSSYKLLLKKDKKKTLIHYEKLAVKLVFSDCSDVNIHECINTSTYDYESIGIITDSQNNTPVFLHASFAEYLAAVYFLKNVKLIPGEKFFNRKYNSVRFFFDMLLAKKSPLHTAILYRNFDELMNYDDEILTRKDEGGRNALHLICSWGQRHRRLRVTSYKINRFLSYLTSVLLKNKSVLKRIPRVRYTLQNDESSEGELETREYLDGVLYLLNKCSISEPDAIFELTPLSYARVSESLGAELELLQSGMLDLQPEQLYDHCDRINILYYTSLFGYDKGIRMIATKELSTYYEEVNFICKFSEITPLAIASSNGHLAVVEYLLELGAGIDDIDKNGRTPLYTASENGHEKIVECLVECGVEIDLANKNGETPLYVAAEKGHEKTVKFLVQYGAEINRASKYGDTPLHAASSKGHEKIVEYLMQFGAEINRADDVGWTPLRAAYWNGHKNIVQCLMTRGAEINCADKRGETLLYVASSKGHNEIVECLVKCRAEVNGTDNYVRTPLYAAAKNGHENVVECLLECEAEINLADYKDRTPLHAASWNGHEKIVECLAKFGAEIDSPDYNGQTPLYAASSNGHKYIVEILLKLGAQINHADYKNRTPLYVASLNGHQKVVECLVKCGAEIKCANKPDRTALHAAAKSGHEKIVEYLVHSGAELDIGDHLGWTSLHLASKNGHEKVVECLVKFGAEINRLGFNGWTPLYAAALNGHETIVEYLMSHKADINRANKSGQTPLYAASSSGHLTIVEYLVINGAEISCGNDFLSTPLYAASSKGHEKIAEYLMKCEAKLI